jgi:SAM-dependent methyltransferase
MDAKTYPPVLDACCGSRMFWFDKNDGRALYVDKRQERHTLPDVSSAGGARELVIDPDHVADFTDLPFPSDTFYHVVFDPPHIIRDEPRGWITHKYGVLNGDWRDMLRRGFSECFRVLRPGGTLVFKWADSSVPVREILELTPEKPLYGHKSGKTMQTHWIAFLKTNTTKMIDVPVTIPTIDGNGVAETVMVRVPCTVDQVTGEETLGGYALAEMDRVKARHMGLQRMARNKLKMEAF